MKQVNCDNLEDRVRDTFYKSRSERYGFTIGQSTDYTLVQFERVTERSEIEHLIVFLSMGKILLGEQSFDEDVKQDLIAHHEKQTLLRYKDKLNESDFFRLSEGLETLLKDWNA